MYMIEAVIKPARLDQVKTALADLGILGITAVECKGFGKQMGHTERYRGTKMDVGFVPKVLLKICVKRSTASGPSGPSSRRPGPGPSATARSSFSGGRGDPRPDRRSRRRRAVAA